MQALWQRELVAIVSKMKHIFGGKTSLFSYFHMHRKQILHFVNSYTSDRMAFFTDGNFHDGGLTRQKFYADSICLNAPIDPSIECV